MKSFLRLIVYILKKTKYYKKFSNIYRIFFNPFFLYSPIKASKKLLYKLEEDFNYNEKFLTNLEFDIEKIKLDLQNFGLDYYNYHISWHYHLFSGLSQKFKHIRILEIGTLRGHFTSFLSKIFSDSEIVTCDLPENGKGSINSYERNNIQIRNKYIENRNKNLNKKNIKFLELDSAYLLDHFGEKKFDLIWIDGDHLNPQVTIDILQCRLMLKSNGIMLCDDIIKTKKIKTSSSSNSSESFETLDLLNKKNLLNNQYLIKRISRINSLIKGYIAYTTKN